MLHLKSVALTILELLAFSLTPKLVWLISLPLTDRHMQIQKNGICHLLRLTVLWQDRKKVHKNCPLFI